MNEDDYSAWSTEKEPNFLCFFVTFLHQLPKNFGQLHEDGGADRGLGVTFPPGVSLSSQHNGAICTNTYTKKWTKA